MNIKAIRIYSTAFTNNERIPKRYTSDGENISPPLEWSGVPQSTQQLALICHDPDAPLPQGFTHWLIYNIAPTVNQIAEAEDPLTFLDNACCLRLKRLAYLLVGLMGSTLSNFSPSNTVTKLLNPKSILEIFSSLLLVKSSVSNKIAAKYLSVLV